MRQDRDASEPAGSARSADAESTRRNILDVATAEFASKGYSGGRIDEIAARTNTSKRMIYYYFADKEGLYVAVLEEAYRRIRSIENTLDLEHLDPEEALETLVGFTFDYQNANPDFIRLVMVENIHHGEHLKKSRAIHDVNVSVIDKIKRLYQRGVAAGVFRKGLDPVDIHMSISALCFFNVSNRATFSTIFERDMASPKALGKRRAIVVDTILRSVRA
jgi:AcrR family transcriptional regulator